MQRDEVSESDTAIEMNLLCIYELNYVLLYFNTWFECQQTAPPTVLQLVDGASSCHNDKVATSTRNVVCIEGVKRRLVNIGV